MTAGSSQSPAEGEQPTLWLGMSGFSPQQRTQLEAALQRPAGVPQWRVCAFGDADAWWVNGSKVRLMADGNLKVAAGLPTERALKLDLSEVDRPVAFALPLPGDEFEPRHTFDPASAASIGATLLQFDTWLWQVRAQFVLGARIIERGDQLRASVQHITYQGRLLAVLDFQNGRAGLAPRVHPVELWEAHWERRPVSAYDLPVPFVRVTPAQLAWAYVRRTDRDMLPARYREGLVYYRHVPAVPLRWLRDSQLMLLRELATEPGSIEELRQRTGFPRDQVEHDLTCLYYANAITTTASRAAEPLRGRQDSEPHSRGPGLDSLMRNDSHEHFESDFTAPALLEPRRRKPSEPPA